MTSSPQRQQAASAITVAETDIPTATNPPLGIMLPAELLAVDVELEPLVAFVFVPLAVAVLDIPMERLDNGEE